jgi:hypothetical protein
LQERRTTEVADVERKFLMDKALLQEKLERQREQIILEARAEAENGLHAKTRQIWLDNKRYGHCDEKGDKDSKGGFDGKDPMGVGVMVDLMGEGGERWAFLRVPNLIRPTNLNRWTGGCPQLVRWTDSIHCPFPPTRL